MQAKQIFLAQKGAGQLDIGKREKVLYFRISESYEEALNDNKKSKDYLCVGAMPWVGSQLRFGPGAKIQRSSAGKSQFEFGHSRTVAVHSGNRARNGKEHS